MKAALPLVREHIPLEQGLRRHLLLLSCCNALAVREHIPLEQGLRLIKSHQYTSDLGVREHIPLEQGLRPHYVADR